MYIDKKDLTTHIREEQLTSISRSDDTIIYAAISGAIEEAKGYLTPIYDIDKIFNADDPRGNGLLKSFIKDICIYHFISINNAGTGYELRKARYDRAIKWLEDVQKGRINPDLPVLLTESGEQKITSTIISSNPKRENHF